MINPLKKVKANKKLDKLIDQWNKTDKKIAPSEYVKMTHKEFQDWCSTGTPPDRFMK